MPMKLPILFDAPAEPLRTGDIAVTSATTPRQLTVRTMFSAKKYTVPAGVLLVAHQLGAALIPVIMGLAIDRAISARDPRQLILWTAVLAVDYAFVSFTFRFGGRIGFLGMNAVQHRVRTQITDRILHAEGMAGPDRQPGLLLSIATSDARHMAMAVAIVVYPLGEFAAVVFAALILLYVSWPLGLAIAIATPLMLWLMDRAGSPLRRRSVRQQQVAGEAAGTAADLVNGFRVVKGLGAEREAGRRYRAASERALQGTLRANVARGGYLGSMDAVSGLFIAGVAVAAGMMALNGAMTVGQLITVVGVTQFVLGPLQAFASNFGTIWAGALASAERVLTVLQAPPRTRNTQTPDTPRGFDLEVSGVPCSEGVVADFVVREGELVAVESDAPTTAALSEVLAGLVRPVSGTATIGGVGIDSIERSCRRKALIVAPHESDLFEGTVADNISMSGQVSGDAVARALLAAGCDDVAASLPDGLDTDVGEAGRLLSGGQRQRVALARALASDPEILVLVDPTTAVDSVTESMIAQRITQARSGRTTLIFTSSPALVAVASRQLVVGQASNDEILENAR